MSTERENHQVEDVAKVAAELANIAGGVKGVLFGITTAQAHAMAAHVVSLCTYHQAIGRGLSYREAIEEGWPGGVPGGTGLVLGLREGEA